MARCLAPIGTGMFYFHSKALDGDVDHLRYAEPVPKELAKFDPRNIYGGGAAVSSVNVPTRLLIKGRKRKLLDIANALHIYIVTRAVIDIIGNFQREIQYFPVQCVWKDGSDAGQLFWLFTTVLLDAVHREKTTMPWQVAFAQSPVSGYWREQVGATFAFDKAKMGNAHFWKDPHGLTLGPLVSDALFEALIKANISGFHTEAEHFEEV